MKTIAKRFPWTVRLLGVAAVILLASYRVFSQASNGPCGQTLTEALQADAQHYLPGDTVTLAGTGFAPSCELPHGIYRVLCFAYSGAQQSVQQTHRDEVQRALDTDEHHCDAVDHSGGIWCALRRDQQHHNQDAAQSQRPRISRVNRPLRPALQFGADPPGIILGQGTHHAIVQSSRIGNREGKLGFGIQDS